MKKDIFVKKFTAMLLMVCMCSCILSVGSDVIRCRAGQNNEYNEDYESEYIESNLSGDNADWKDECM